MEIVDRAPDIRRGSAIIDKECVSPSAASQEVRTGPTVQHICPAVHRNSVVATTRMDEPIVIAHTDIQVVAGYADILVLQTADWPGVEVW